MKLTRTTLAFLIAGTLVPSIASSEPTTRLRKVVAGQEAVVARHSAWNSKCESIEVPVIKIGQPPKHGRIQSNPTEYSPTSAVPGARNTQCLGKQMTGVALAYVADPKFVGQDEITYTVHFAKRRAGAQKDFTYRVVLNVAASEQIAKATLAEPAVAVAPPPTPLPPAPAPTVSAAARKEVEGNPARELTQVQQTQKALQEGQQNLASKQAATSDQVSKVENALGGIVLPAWTNPSEWMMRVAAVPIQQQQFCRIVDRFYGDLEQVYLARNEIKQNALYRDRKLDLATLLPAGDFNNWVVQVKEVVQAPDGSAAVMLQPPCRAMLGSDACQKDPSKIRATISTASPLYRELARVSAGDFVVVSGKLLYAEAANADEALPTYAVYRPGQHCSSTEGTKQEDVFVTEIRYLVQLR